MKKRMLCTCMVVAFLFICLLQIGPVLVNAEATPTSGSCGQSAQWNFDAATGTLTISGTGEMEFYNSSSRAPWNAYKSKIQKIVVQQGITSINRAFSGCTVKTVELGANVARLDSMAFYNCPYLKTIYFKGSAPQIAQDAFVQVTAAAFYPASDSTWIAGKEQKLVDCEITWCADDGKGAQVSDLHGDLKWELKGDTLYIEPNNGGKAPYMNPQPAWLDYKGVIKKVVMTGEIEEVGICAFEGCSELTEVQWPTGIKTISMEAFKGCTSLETLTIPDTVTYISVRAFSGCYGLKTIHLPKYLHEVDLEAFRGCSGLKSITFPANVLTIKECAFESCKSLESIYFTGAMPVVYASGGNTGVNVQIGTTQIPVKSSGTFGKIGSTVTVYYPEDAIGWTEDCVQRLAEQNITFTAYRQKTEEPGKTPNEITGTANQEQPKPSDPVTNPGSTEPESTDAENIPTTGESQKPMNNTNETDPQQTVPGNGKEDHAQENRGTKAWIPVVIVVVVAAGAVGAYLIFKKKM